LDITLKMIMMAKKKFTNNSNIEITLGSAIKIPYKDTFDYVTCISSFHHHPDPSQSAKKMVRVLKPGGKIIILDMRIEGLIRKILFQLENLKHKEVKVFRLTNREMKDLFE
jgi:ubiquinone/menaquinone biosynthesis C-methylase UbiE